MTAPIPVSIDAAGALERIRPLIRTTPVLHLTAPGLPSVAAKLESLQVTGSFKVRGAANAILGAEGPPPAHVVACSSGNHGRAVAHVAAHAGIPATICVPRWVDPLKRSEIERTGATIEVVDGTYDDAEDRAMELARSGALLVHPFDDPAVIEGQATVAAELTAAIPGLRTVAVPLSGGGLAGGMACHLKPLGVRVVAVSAASANVMLRSIEAGRPTRFPEEPTVASALSGGIGQDNRYTFTLIRDLIDDHVVVSDPQIERAMAWAFREGLVVEGGGAVALAAWLSGNLPITAAESGSDDASAQVAIVVSGGNVTPSRLAEIVLGTSP